LDSIQAELEEKAIVANVAILFVELLNFSKTKNQFK
jgi:hypothetical protein